MPRTTARLLVLLAALIAATGGLPTADPVARVQAADAPWTLPTVPPKCTKAQTDIGDVAGCVITLDTEMPEQRGWPAPPFPEPVSAGVVPWVDLARGASGPMVAKVQQALIDRGATIAADGQFGPVTEAAVIAHQRSTGLAQTGVVNEATATSLGVQNTATGAFPPPNWNWLGWGYNGSPALTAWEQLLVSNAAQVGTVRAGTLRSFSAALPLFEGFYAEIQARGYQIRNGGSYVFRCTATTRKDCNGLTRASLSNHAYGLATDINTAENPLVTYRSIGGASACQTPMATDIPQWVVQVAEKWGLYWGGYGWSSGCSSPAQMKSSASRDPMHFEFNGTPEMARAIWLNNVGRAACVDLAATNGTISKYCYARTEVPAATTRTVIDTDAPAGAKAALVNLTATSVLAPGFVTAEACTPMAAGSRAWSNGNPRPGRATASASIVALDDEGRFCLYQSAPMHTIVDVQGYFVPTSIAPSGSLYTPIEPIRVTDTRKQAACTPEGVCTDLGPVAALTELVHTFGADREATATIANVTVVRPAAPGYLSAGACDALTPGPQPTSALNFLDAEVVSNLALVGSATNEQGVQFCTFATSHMQLVIDVQGFFGPAAQGGLAFDPVAPSRLVDTRRCWTDALSGSERCGLPSDGGTILHLRAPAGAAAVAVGLIAVQPQVGGYLSASACDTMETGPQKISNVNAAAGTVATNLAIVPVGADGTFCIYTATQSHVVVDLVGTFSTNGSLRLVPITPTRVHDSRRPA